MTVIPSGFRTPRTPVCRGSQPRLPPPKARGLRAGTGPQTSASRLRSCSHCMWIRSTWQGQPPPGHKTPPPPAIASTSSRRELFQAPKWFRSLLCVEQWLSPRGTCPPGDRWQCLELSLVVTLGDRGGATGIRWAEPRDATKHPTLHRTAPTARNSPAPNVRSAEAKETLMWGLRKAGLAPRS